MRPALLDPLFAPVTTLAGIGPKLAKLLARLLARDDDEARVIDLLFHTPNALIDRRLKPGIAHLPEGAIVTVEGRVDRHQKAPPRSNAPTRVYLHDDTDELMLTFFHAKSDWLDRALPVGEDVVVSGRAEWFNGRPSMVHPDYIVPAAESHTLPEVEPVYPMTGGLSAKVLRRSIENAEARIPDFPDWIDAEIVRRQGFPTLKDALLTLHNPRDETDLDPQSPARRRLAYDEFLAGQLSLALVRSRMRRAKGRPVHPTGALSGKVALPFSLTAGQNEAIAAILADMGKETRMLRMLQGDVGSGKTVVGLMAMLAVVEDGGQAALMAPTEILARQHFDGIAALAESAGVTVRLLTGKTKAKDRRLIEAEIADGSANIVIGTHALFQDNVNYHDLRLVIVDEQHRFGVHQRLKLTAKGAAPHLLVMTATPIPRTLVLAAFGDMDVSNLTEKPAGRKPIQTVTIPLERIGDVVGRLREALTQGKKSYWICPLVEESEAVELMSAEERFETLAKALGPEHVGLIHGRMSSADKDAAMEDFKAGRTRLLVATTVVEVGVDVPDATIIVIEHAERFGLAQLHQLRGRVGRGDEASSCILLYKGPLSETGRARLSVLRESNDGFRIAEEDLKLRGEGELLGTRQSGIPGFRFASLEAHGDILALARKDAAYVVNKDAELMGERGQALRTLLYLFRRDEAIRYLNAG
ncbi:ATP-dependent DNA helicase RecG [Martelella endophytica]|uniref:ATP-dependent DNA helicase RecG n=1 Tax=Martelella endophytica TaxID=1486262 RepID=A0A0D5LRU4_MAREN|nr:ATP-dependent DNA helicase RecG [Martelella endophytica]AJY46889.1 ATP-dependent DNA helicase RecG [Martelella endophytica]